MNLEAKIEAVLFFKGEPVSLNYLAKTLKCDLSDLESAVEELANSLRGRGLTLVRKEDEVMLGTAPELSSFMEEITKEELTRDLGKAGLETLAIILYRGPVARKDIDYIRGVNSNFILRNLQIRGLVEKTVSKNDERVHLYKPTFELLQYMGLKNVKDLPEYFDINNSVDNIKKPEDNKDVL